MGSRLPPLVLLAALPPALLLPAGTGDAGEARRTPTAQQLYDSLPEAEREPFLAYELALGLEQVASRNASLAGAAAEALGRLAPSTGHVQAQSGSLADKLHHLYGIPAHLLIKFQNLPTPSDFDINMYIWVKISTNPTFQQMVQLAATGQYCVGVNCYSLQEPWGNCCPF
ncbi:uncharacterized protein LOC126236252 [Schistocerca nitens]|uniref:uncharacterized protein LOC126236252 n=1 Tax=Schistocerca nitens TaxID=7011 RepID=UPI0021185CB3|nr:uncharacterized protein LOC126236252 [Schistocerca nitens]